MIRIKPTPEVEVTCPKCSRAATVHKITIYTIFTLADCRCQNCDFGFYQTLAHGHTVINTITIDKSDNKLIGDDESWLPAALLKVLNGERQKKISINKIIYERHARVVILNALDFLYGHVLLKLYNALYHLDHHKDVGLVLIIPKSFEWLVPKGCAEVWIVDVKLSELCYGHASIRQFISLELERFETVYLSKAYSHPDFTTINISRLTGVNPFDLETFSRQRQTITFVLREDRWWLKGRLSYWFYRVCRKMNVLRIGSQILSSRQNNLVKKTIRCIQAKWPDANFHITGLGSVGTFRGYAHDRRKTTVNESIEGDWCRIYAQSHLVIGVHGSNMLLPTAHAAGCIEILPEDRYGNIVQDISVRYADRRQLYFYRFANQYASPRAVANMAIATIENFDVFEKNMCRNLYSRQKNHHPVARPQDDIYATF